MKSSIRIIAVSTLALYSLILFCVMTLYRLPADKLIAATVEKASGGKVRLHTERVFPGLPACYTLQGISASYVLGDAVANARLESLTLRPDLAKSFTGHLPVRFEGNFRRGTLRGRAGVFPGTGTGKDFLSLEVSDLYLEDHPVLKSVYSRNFTGKLKCLIDLKGPLTDLSKMYGQGHFHVANGSIDTRIDLPGLRTVPFESVEIAFTVKNRAMVFDRGDIQGPMFSGNFSGNIQLEKSLGDSRLDVTVKMRPGPLLEKNELAGRFIAKIRKGDLPLIINVKGTLKQPSIAWSKG